MAQDEDKTTVEVGEGEGEEQKPKKGMSNLILFGGIGVGVVVVGVLLALFVLKPMMASSGEGGDETTLVEDGHEAKSEEGHQAKPKPKKKAKKKSGGHGDGEAVGSIVYVVKDIVVNPAGTSGTRFLSVSFGFELGSASLESVFDDREPLVRDALITIMSSKTVAQLTDAKQKEIVRYQIKKRLSKLLHTDELEAVYYTDFVLQ